MAGYSFHPDALLEYAEAVTYYLHEASPEVAERFVVIVESGIVTVTSAPERWRVIEEPGIRRYLFRRFPYVLYYRWDVARDWLTVYALMHSSREPGSWRERIV